MGNMRLVAISVLAVWCFGFTSIFPQTPFNYDSIPMSFGYAVPDYRNHSIEDSQPLQELIFCDPIYRDSTKDSEYNYEEIYEALVIEPKNLEFFVGALSTKYISKYFKDLPGDTITLLSADGLIPTIIQEIDYWGGYDFWQIGCRLEPISISPKLSSHQNFIALRKSFAYAGPLYNYNLLSPNTLPNEFLDSLRFNCINERLKQLSDLGISLLGQNYSNYLRYCTLTLYIRNPKPTIDTILVTANLYDTLTAYFSQVYRAIKDSGNWKFNLVLDHSLWGKISGIGYSFDLNNDGRLEYLVKERSEGAFSVMYSDTDSGWVVITYGRAEWAE